MTASDVPDLSELSLICVGGGDFEQLGEGQSILGDFNIVFLFENGIM